MGVYCAIFGCLSSSKNDKDRSFFRFPRNESRCKQWIQATNREDLKDKNAETLNKSYFVCDLHFQESDRLVKKLKIIAVPTLNLPHQENSNPTKSTQTHETMLHDLSIEESPIEAHCFAHCSAHVDITPLPDDTMNTETETSQKLVPITPFKRTSFKQIEKQGITESQQNCAPISQKFNKLSPVLKLLIDLHNQLKHNSCGNSYNKQFRLFALNVYFESPLAYRIIAKTLTLPRERILRRTNIKMGTKLYPTVIKCLESKLKNFEESERYCVICADEITLKRQLYYQINEDKIVGFHEIGGIHTGEPAIQAFIIMARGLFSNWKQPLAYCFLGKSKNYTDVLNNWIDIVISKIINIGYRVVAFVSDQSSNFINLAKRRNVSIEKPYFFINEQKIYYIFDVPHLIKSVRNKLIKYDFEFLDKDGTSQTAKWEYIETFYRHDRDRVYRLAPKLNESHISPNSLEKLEVKYTSQVFSSTVAAAMNCSIEFGQLQNTSMGTIKLIELMDKVFDVFNSSIANDTNKYKNAFAAMPHQIEVLDRLDYFLSNVTVYNSNQKNVTKAINCLNGFKITLNSIKSLYQGLQSYGFSYLFTRRLNQEPLEKIINTIRKQCGDCQKPTPIQFSRAFKKFFMVDILKHSQRSNCSDELDKLVTKINDVSRIKILPEDEERLREENTSQSLAVGTIDYRFELPENYTFFYICSYLLKKCFDIHKCKWIKQYVKQNNIKSDHNNAFLINPPESFVTYVKKMDEVLQLYFENKNLNNIGNEILKQISDVSLDNSCPCFPHIFIKKLFIRLRIFNIMRFNNRKFRDKAFNPKYFSINSIS